MAYTSIEVRKNTNENSASLIRRFQRRVQESGMIPHVKSKRYNERAESKLSTKKRALKKMTRRKEVERLKKLGKMS